MKLLLTVIMSMLLLTGFTQTLDSTLNKFIYTWMGRPYRFGGKTKYGIDCSQFTKRLYKDVYGVELQNICKDQWAQTKRVPKDSLQIGDIVFFNSKASPSGWHCGVYIGGNSFVHSSNYRDGVKISSLEESMYKRIYKGAGRL